MDTKKNGALTRFVRDNPGAASAVALAAGFVTGLMIPETDAEHRLMGDTRDTLASQTREVVERTVADVRDTAEQLSGVAEQLTSRSDD